MVQKVSPTVYLYNSTHNLYAVLVQRVSSAGNRFFFVSANAQAGILPSPYAHRYGAEYTTAALAQANIPAGFTVIPAPGACELNIRVVSAIFEGITLAVFKSPANTAEWVLEYSTNGSDFVVAKKVVSLNANSAGGFSSADGEIFYQVPVSSIYQFRVLASQCVSNKIEQKMVTFADAQANELQPATEFTTLSTNQFDITGNPDHDYFFDSWGNNEKTRSQILNAQILKGFDYAAIAGDINIVNEQGFVKPVLQNWTQKLVGFSGSENNIIDEGDKIYYFRPLGYTTNKSYNMFDFHTRFPEFTLPAGKIVAIQPVPFSTSEQVQMLQRGVTHVRNGVPDANKIYFLNDDWLDNVRDTFGQIIPLPPAYQGTEAERQNFYNKVDPYQMAQHLIDTLVLRGRLNNGYIFWNYERVITWDDRQGDWEGRQPNPGDVGKGKRQIFFERFLALKPSTTRFVAWNRKPAPTPVPWLFENTGAVWNAVYSGSVTNLQQLDQVYVANNISQRIFPNGVSGVAAMDIYHSGFYQIGHKSYLDFMYKHVFETYINKKMAPAGKKVIGTLWIDNETLAENDVSVRNFDITRYNETLSIEYKPMASMSYMQSFAAWMTAIGDGFDIWEFREFLEDKATWDRLKNPAVGFIPPHYPTSPLKGVDWAMSAVYSLSVNKDVLDAPTEWQFPVDPWTAAVNKSPLIAWKLNASGDIALVLAMNAYNDDLGIKTVSVVVGGVAQTIKIHGKFTSIVRILL